MVMSMMKRRRRSGWGVIEVSSERSLDRVVSSSKILGDEVLWCMCLCICGFICYNFSYSYVVLYLCFFDWYLS